MIRINLLKSRAAAPAAAPQTQEAPLKPSGSSTFISRREVALGGLFLLLGGAILATQMFDVFEDPELVEQMSGEAPPKEIAVAMPASPPSDELAAAPQNNSAVAEREPAADPEPDSAPAAPKPSPKRQKPAAPVTPAPAEAKTPTRFVTPAGAIPVRDIQIVPWGDAAEVFISVSGAEYSTFRLENPPRFVVDIQNAELRIPSRRRNLSVDHAAIGQVRAAQNSFDPALVRVVIETASSAPEVSTTPTGISVKLGPQ
jgi:hypothetical protein